MKELRIDFIDFWPNIKKEDNYFYNLLSEHFTVIIDNINPDLIFYSCFGLEHLKYKCKRILFLGENMRPDLNGADLVFSYDFINKKKHYRLPLYLLYVDDHKMNEKIYQLKTRDELEKIWNSKSKFCCMVVSNPNAQERIDFFKKLSKTLPVDSGGKVLNNVGGRVKDKMEFIKDYKFVISFENGLQDGYTTEKILEPIMKDCIPIYWGNEKIHKDFNTERFINYHDFKNEDELIEQLVKINDNPSIAIEMLLKPVFNKENLNCLEHRANVLSLIKQLIDSNEKPAAKTYLELLHLFKIWKQIIINSLKRRFKKNMKWIYNSQK